MAQRKELTQDNKAELGYWKTHLALQLTTAHPTGHRSWLLVFLSFNLCVYVYAIGVQVLVEEIPRNWSCEKFMRSQTWEL